jgi:hypothetical protein
MALDFSSRATSSDGLDFSAQAEPAKKRSFLAQIGDTVSGAVDKLKADTATAYRESTARASRPAPGLIQAAKQSVDDTGRTFGLLGDAAGVVASPVAGLIHAAVVKPGADLLDKVPIDAYATPDIAKPSTWMKTPRLLSRQEKHAANEGLISTSLMGLGPEAAPSRGMIATSKGSTLADTVTRFDRAGVDPMLAASGGKGASTLTNVVAENPVAGGLVRGRLRKAVQQTGDSATDLAARYGETRGAQITGENIQAGVTRFARDRRDPTSFAAKAGARYDAVFNNLDTAMAGKTDVGSSQVQTPATTQALKDINGSTQSAAVGSLIADPTLGKVAQTITDAAGAKDMSFGDLRRLRTWVRDAQKDPELRQKIGPANLSRLEGTLTQDIYTNAGKLGSPELAGQLRRADQYYAAGQARIQDALQSFADARSGESAYARVLQSAGSTSSADAAKLLSLKRSLAPDEWGDVAANVAAELGKPAPGAAPAGSTGFSVGQFVTKYNQLSPRGRDVLFGATGGGGAKASALRAELDNLASVADDLKNIEKGANTSKSAVGVQTVGTIGGLVSPATALPTAAGLGGMALTGEALTNPVVVRWLAKLGRAQKAGPKSVGVVVKQLRSASRMNAALAPVYQESMKLLPAPQPVLSTAAAEDQSQAPGP